MVVSFCLFVAKSGFTELVVFQVKRIEQRLIPGDWEIMVLSKEFLTSYHETVVKRFDYDFIVIDEAHNYSNPTCENFFSLDCSADRKKQQKQCWSRFWNCPFFTAWMHYKSSVKGDLPHATWEKKYWVSMQNALLGWLAHQSKQMGFFVTKVKICLFQNSKTVTIVWKIFWT